MACFRILCNQARKKGFTIPLVPNVLSHAERAVILQALDEVGWVVGGPKGAAVKLGVRRTTLIHKMKRLGIRKPRPHSSQNVVDPTRQQPEPPYPILDGVDL
jgi:DNA-binding NtrC family response regulator